MRLKRTLVGTGLVALLATGLALAPITASAEDVGNESPPLAPVG